MTAPDRNYTDVGQSGIDAKAKRVGDITSEPPTNEAYGSRQIIQAGKFA